MEEIDVKHIHVLEFPKQLLWTDRDLDYFLEEMPSEASRMNNDVYEVLEMDIQHHQSHVDNFSINYER